MLRERLVATGIDGSLAYAVSVSALPPLAAAVGVRPQCLVPEGTPVPGATNPRLTEKDTAMIEVAQQHYAPTVEGIRRLVDDPATQGRVAELVARRDATAAILAGAQTLLRVAADNGDPHEVHRARAAVKDAALDSVVADKAVRDCTHLIGEDIHAALRGESLVERYEGDLIRHGEDPDPASITPLRAMGLSSVTGENGALKPMYGDAQARANAAAATRSAPEPEDRIGDYLLGEVDREMARRFDGTVQKVGAVVGTGGNGTAYVDGLMLRKGEPAAVVMVADDSEYKNGVPTPETRARALYAAQAAGVSGAAIIGLVDGKPHRTELTLDSPVDGSPHGKSIIELSGKIASNREAMTAIASSAGGASYGSSGRGRGTINDRDRNEMRDTESNLSALLHGVMSPFEVRRELARRRGQDGMSADAAVRSMIGDYWSREKMGVLAGVDGETAGITDDRRAFEPAYADWIETGIVTHGADGRQTGTFQRLHGVDPRIMRTNGTGAQHIHNISPEMVAGKPRLESPQERDTVAAELLKGDVLVAHNTFFESKHLNAAIPDFEGKRPWLDTMWLAKHFLPETGTTPGRSGLKLAHFVEDTGGTYSGGHRAATDAAMMMTAAEKMFATPRWWERREA